MEDRNEIIQIESCNENDTFEHLEIFKLTNNICKKALKHAYITKENKKIMFSY